MADDDRRASVPGHPALAQVAPRGGARRARARPDRRAERTGSTPRTKLWWPIRLVSRCSWCSKRWVPPSDSRSCCTTCSQCPSGDRFIVRRSPSAARQLASRARRRVQAAAEAPDADLTCQREVVDAFLAAARGGDFDALLAVLDPDVVVRADRGDAPRAHRGSSAVRAP